MDKCPWIYFKDKLIPAKITIKELENPKNLKKKSIIKYNPKKLVYILSKAYKIRPEIIIHKSINRIINNEKADILLKVILSELDISVHAFAPTKRSAWRKAFFKLHYCYNSKLVYI